MLKDQLSQDLKEAMRARDDVRLRTIRGLRAALLEREIAERQGGEATLTEEQEVQVIQKQAKQRRDAAEQYQAAGRDDLAERELEELRVIDTYLPQQMNDVELDAAIREIIAQVGATSARDTGKVMGEAMRSLRGKADGRRVQQMVQSLLAGK